VNGRPDTQREEKISIGFTWTLPEPTFGAIQAGMAICAATWQIPRDTHALDAFLSLNQKFGNAGRRTPCKRHGFEGGVKQKAWGSDHDKTVSYIGVEFNYFCSDSERPDAVASADRA
jgi:hypothetical protein